MTLRGALLAATMLALPVAASAQPVNGLYIGLGAGVNLMQDQSATASVPGGSASGDLQLHLGPAVVGSIGWGFGNGLRAEIEGNFRYNSIHGATGAGSGLNIGGNEQKFGGMVNVLYDFYGLTPYFDPYVGAGVGYVGVFEQNLHGAGTVGGTYGNATFSNQTKGSFAYQAIIGAAMPIQSVPGLALTAEYRFMGLAGDRTYNGTITTASGATTPVNLKTDNNFNHSFLLGIRYNFGQTPPPPPAPAPAPAPVVQPARSYLVFFDWDKATLTDRARQIIKEAADNSTRVKYTQIEVNGYTDTSGPADYNMKLSMRRAQAVAAELVRNGVPKNVIAIQGFGETHLLVPTGPNVREPQNRRVEIIIR